MIRVIIVDDEKKARETIANMVALYCSHIEIIGEAADISSARELIRIHKPDLVFLDVAMPGGGGFDLLESLSSIDFRIIFITAHSEYAIRAFKFSALDYLLKPIDPGELIEALDRARLQLDKDQQQLRIETLFANMGKPAQMIRKLVLKTAESIHVVNVKDIIRCEADGNYTRFFFVGSKRLLVSTTLKDYDDLLSGQGFFRPHQSHLVNIDFIESYERRQGGSLLLKDGTEVPVSLRKREALLALLENL